jgi:hypothetical protein
MLSRIRRTNIPRTNGEKIGVIAIMFFMASMVSRMGFTVLTSAGEMVGVQVDAGTVGPLVTALGYLVVGAALLRWTNISLQFHKPTRREAGIAGGIVAVLFFVSYLAPFTAASVRPGLPRLTFGAAAYATIAINLVLYAILVPIATEYLFRGTFQEWLQESVAPPVAIVVPVVLIAFNPLIWAIIQIERVRLSILVFFLAYQLLLGVLYNALDNLSVPMLVAVLFEGSWMLLPLLF